MMIIVKFSADMYMSTQPLKLQIIIRKRIPIIYIYPIILTTQVHACTVLSSMVIKCFQCTMKQTLKTLAVDVQV